jgi:hypothetical protein
MKKQILIGALLLGMLISAKAQNAWTNKSRLLPDKLRELPVGIAITHDPNPCYPVKEGDTYYWKHHTSAVSFKGDLTVLECGSFIWYDSTGWHDNMHYTPAEVAEKFNCKNAVLKAGKTYQYEKNWRLGKQAYGGDALWYIIAKDKNGKLYKGYALIETEDKVQPNK